MLKITKTSLFLIYQVESFDILNTDSLEVNRIFHSFFQIGSDGWLALVSIICYFIAFCVTLPSRKDIKSFILELLYIFQNFYIRKSLQNSSKRQDRILNLTALISCLVLISVMQVSDWFESTALSENVRLGTTTPCGERYGLWNFCLGYCTKRERFKF